MNTIHTSIRIDKDILLTLKTKKISVNGIVNDLLQKWIEGHEITEKFKIEQEIEQIKNKIGLLQAEKKAYENKLKQIEEEEEKRLIEEKYYDQHFG